MNIVEKYKGHWFWCTTCHVQAVHFDCCNNSTCNGGGCDKCTEDSKAITALPESELPPKESIPHTREQLIAFFREVDKRKGLTDAECDEKQAYQLEMEALMNGEKKIPKEQEAEKYEYFRRMRDKYFSDRRSDRTS